MATALNHRNALTAEQRMQPRDLAVPSIPAFSIDILCSTESIGDRSSDPCNCNLPGILRRTSQFTVTNPI